VCSSGLYAFLSRIVFALTLLYSSLLQPALPGGLTRFLESLGPVLGSRIFRSSEQRRVSLSQALIYKSYYVKALIGLARRLRAKLIRRVLHINGDGFTSTIRSSVSRGKLRLPESSSRLPRYRHKPAVLSSAARHSLHSTQILPSHFCTFPFLQEFFSDGRATSPPPPQEFVHTAGLISDGRHRYTPPNSPRHLPPASVFVPNRIFVGTAQFSFSSRRFVPTIRLQAQSGRFGSAIGDPLRIASSNRSTERAAQTNNRQAAPASPPYIGRGSSGSLSAITTSRFATSSR